jgi:hypothetical protein
MGFEIGNLFRQLQPAKEFSAHCPIGSIVAATRTEESATMRNDDMRSDAAESVGA